MSEDTLQRLIFNIFLTYSARKKEPKQQQHKHQQQQKLKARY